MAWTSLTYSFGSTLTSTKMTQNQDNFTAVAQGLSGAPKILADALNQVASSEAVVTAAIRDGAVTEAKLATLSIPQGKLKTTTGDTTWGIGVASHQALAGGFYGFYPQIAATGTVFDAQFALGFNGTATIMYGNNTGGGTATITQRYVQASPPWESFRPGELVPLFIFLLLEKGSGKVKLSYVAEDPPWANNGPTILNPYGRFQQLVNKRIGMDLRTAKASPAALALYLTKLNDTTEWLKTDEAKALVSEEMKKKFTQQEKNADMQIVPHPFIDYNPLTDQIVVVDPTESAFCHQLHCLHGCGENLADILHGGYLNFDNIPIAGLSTPSMVLPIKATWKLT